MGVVRTHLLDATALVKLVVDEDKSDRVRKYYRSQSVFWTTSVCFSEALGVLKRKWLNKSKQPKCKMISWFQFSRKQNKFAIDAISTENYYCASEELVALLRNDSISLEEVPFTDRSIYDETETLSKKYKLDIIDAFQLVTLLRGFPSKMIGGSKTIFITADRKLAKAAKSEGLRPWNCMKESSPL